MSSTRQRAAAVARGALAVAGFMTIAASGGAQSSGAHAFLSGTLRADDGRPIVSAALVLIAVGTDRSQPLRQDVRLQPDGRFEIRTIPPGRYILRARGQTTVNGPVLFGMLDVIVGEGGRHGVDVVLARGGSIEGSVVVQPASRRVRTPVDYARLRIRLRLADGSNFGDPLTGTVSPTGTFRIDSVMAGAQFLQLEGLEPPWVVKEISHRGRDLTHSPLEIPSGALVRGVRIVLAPEGRSPVRVIP